MARGPSISDYGLGPWRFIGRVASEGYRWDDGDDGPCLVDAETGGKGRRVMMDYEQTLKRPIHRAMWEVYKRHKPGDGALQDAVLTLATRYGELCPPETFSLRSTPSGVVSKANPGVSLKLWAETIRDVGRLTALWDSVRERNVPRLGRLVTWHPTKATATAVAITWSDGWGGDFGPVISDAIRRPALIRQFLRLGGTEAVATIARFALADELNHHLKGAVTVALLPTVGTDATGLVGVPSDIGEVVVRVGDEPIGPYGLLRALVPHDLRAVAFLQLHSEIAGDRTYNQCAAPGCGVWFEPETRSHQRYCGEACSKRAQRARQRASSASPPT